MGPQPPSLSLPAPTRVRYGVLAFACSLSLITYLDRICIMRVKDDMRGDLGLSDAQFGWVFNAFTLGYLLFEVPGGWMGDVWGARRVLTRIVLWWSAFTALTGAVWSFTLGAEASVFGLINGGFLLLLLVRFLFGCGEAGAYPNLARVTGNWFPFQERGLALGAIWTCARLGGAMAPFVIGRLTHVLGWRAAFWALGLIGIAWCTAFYPWFRNSPGEKPECNEAERELIQAGPYSTKASHGSAHAWPPLMVLLLSPSMWALCVASAGVSFGWYFYATWQFNFLQQVHHVSDEYAEVIAGLPFLTGAAGALIGGGLSDRLVRTIGRRWGRSLIGVLGFGGAGLCVVLAGLVPASETWLAVTLLSLATFINDMAVPVIWAASTDIGGKFAGTVCGVMNMMGGLGPLISQWRTPIWRDSYGWTTTLAILSAGWFVAALGWLFVDASRPLMAEPAGDARADMLESWHNTESAPAGDGTPDEHIQKG